MTGYRFESEDEQQQPLDPAAERLRRKLARLLMLSGGIMVLGFIAVFAAIVYRLSGSAGTEAPFAAVAATIPLPVGARLLRAELEGGRALLHLEHDDGSASLVLVDLESGAVLGRYGLVRE